jgi:acetyltransferase-like isoleucine patch superfamily enzyme
MRGNHDNIQGSSQGSTYTLWSGTQSGNPIFSYRETLAKKMPDYMKQFKALYKKCRRSNSSFLIVILRLVFYRIIYNKIFLLHQNVKINGVKNIDAKERVEIGMGYVGFIHKSDKTLLNIKGKLSIAGKYNIGRGCSFEIGRNASVSIGREGYINCNTNIIIMHSLVIGDECAISWNCQFLDEDFHSITYTGKKETENSINIGNKVWIGCGVKIYKGTVIPNGCVIASDSIVKGSFVKENCLIGGNPAKVLKEDIHWQ